jgi:hypothetical protein
MSAEPAVVERGPHFRNAPWIAISASTNFSSARHNETPSVAAMRVGNPDC